MAAARIFAAFLMASVVFADEGNWTIDNCIYVRMNAALTVLPVLHNSSVVINEHIPLSAKATGECKVDKKPDQLITLTWEVAEPTNSTEKLSLNRNISITYSSNMTATPPVYGVSKIEGVFETKHFIKEVNVTVANQTISKNETFIEYVSFTSFAMQDLEFQTPINRSYLCMDVGVISMHAELHDTSEQGGGSGEKLNNVNFTATSVQFDAFRPVDLKPSILQTPLDCDFKPSDVVPIVVGCALAGTVLLVLIAYLVGRRKNRARGYQSV